ncbi:MAG: class I SAM-dependent methyltransferase [Dehalococcoidales bacterium]|nr:class I SAM-dependent methyltransferase [Dehalococcoidales bacterium]
MRYWHDVLPQRFSMIERFNHGFPRARRVDWQEDRIRTLEIGAGSGGHLAFEDLSFQDYTALELRESMAARIRERYPQVEVLIADVQEHIPAADAHFDRVVAVHVLEHLPNLPAALAEVRRVLKPSGRFTAVLPCEGGLVYGLGHDLTTRRLFQKRYHTSYDWCIRFEHINTCSEIMEELARSFEVVKTRFWPLWIPITHANAIVGLVCEPRNCSELNL